MTNGYLIFIGGFLFIAIIGFFLSRKNKKSNEISQDTNESKEKKIYTIDAGTISIFFESSKKVIIIPYVKDLLGEGKAIKFVQKLEPPYSSKDLGSVVRKSLGLCKNGVPCNSKELMHELGSNNWTDFSKGKKNMSILYNEKRGLVLNSTTRMNDGSYVFNSKGIEVRDVSNLDDDELGTKILDLLPRCR